MPTFYKHGTMIRKDTYTALNMNTIFLLPHVGLQRLSR